MINSIKGAALSAVSLLLLAPCTSAQSPVPVGRGSYAEFTPLSKGHTDTHGGDQSTLMQSKRLWVTEKQGRPIPTNDWWTGVINARYGDALWSYPAMVRPSASGLTVHYPTYWNDNGTEVKWRTSIDISARGFTPVSAIAHDWHDWDMVMVQPDATGDRSMTTTMVHGTPFTWIEFNGINEPRIQCSDTPRFFNSAGDWLSASTLGSFNGSYIGMMMGDDAYGLYLPQGTRLSMKDNILSLTLPSPDGFIVVGLLPASGFLADYAGAAYNIPRNTTVSWNYNETRGEITSTWKVDTENLVDGSRGGNTLQGFLPHAYKSALRQPSYRQENYLTPRGTMRMAEGREFSFTHKFAGMLPWYAHPAEGNDPDHPFSPALLKELVGKYAREGAFGNDTYWGGKGLVQMALNMTFALQAGETELFEMSRDKLKTKLIDWLTYTPGEKEVYFAYYPRWGGLVGQNTSYDSDTFNDHHFHYGYFTLSGAILCMVDEDFKNSYGPMLREIAKDYANWDRNDSRYPFMRTLDPWVGHSYAGGLGDQGNSNGNGQESSSESMQAWGGVYLLGVALGDKEMRDAGIFGWSTEARATREYWFDADHIVHRDGADGNYDYTLYKSPYNSNITCKGIGWWTWFGGDPLFMHGIQWMPISPALDYLSWDRDFVKWAYNDLMNTPGWKHKWFEDDVDPGGNPLEKLAAGDWGNVTLAYMQRALPQEAAAIFDEAYTRKLGLATSVSTGHISYYTIHSHLTYGEIDLTVNADLPSANAFVNDRGDYTYIVYNPDDGERIVNFYRDGSLIRSVKAPGRRMTTFTTAATAETIDINVDPGKRFPLSATLSATVLDQYGATVEGAPASWSVSDKAKATVTSGGKVTWADVADGTDVTVTATSGPISGSITLTKGEVPVIRTAGILPAYDMVEKGTAIDFTLDAKDQYGEQYTGHVEWIINGTSLKSNHYVADSPGNIEVTAKAGTFSTSRKLFVTPSLPNLALGKKATSSSEENAGTLTSSATDGDNNSRWGSLHRDGEWIYVDLGEECSLTRVNINWEAAFSARYLIQVAPEGAATEEYEGEYFEGKKKIQVVAEREWATAAEVSCTGAGWLNTPISDSGRYVRIKSLTRGSAYGTSLLELQVCGIPASAGPTDIVGIEVTTPKDYINENETALFKAGAYHLNGTLAAIPVNWSAVGGTITPEGLFTPATYGDATITATIPGSTTSASRNIAVNEVVKLAALTVTPASVKIAAGESARYEIEGVNQFGGLQPLPAGMTITVTDASGNPASTLTVADGIISASTPGNYKVRFATPDNKTATIMAVMVVPFSDINLALNRPTTAGSGQNANQATDGNSETRWQADPAGAQWLMVELDDLYLVNKFVTRWEAACATRFHIETSLDGETWCDAAASGTPIESAGAMTLTCPDQPARFIRLIPDELSALASQWGMSLFELEVYGSGRLPSDDTQSPVINRAEATGSGDMITLSLNGSDNSGHIFFNIIAREAAAVNPQVKETTVHARSGNDATVTLPGLNGNSRYNITIKAFDAAGNSAETSASATTGTPDLTGINLALGKPVEASTSENDGLKPQYAVDGDMSTRWGSKFNDDEYLIVDLGSAYRVNDIRVTTNDAAYASTARWEYSLDGMTWQSLGDRVMTGTGTDDLPVDGKVMQYFRYTGVKRATGYGISIAELEIYGDARMLSVASRSGGDLKLEGEWDSGIFHSIDNIDITSYDLTAVTGLPAEINPANPNCIIYTSDTGITSSSNIVVVNTDGSLSARAIDLHQGYSFSASADIHVRGTATLHPAVASSPAMAVMLPWDYTPGESMRTLLFDTVNGGEAQFYPVDKVTAHTPMLISSASPILSIASSGVTIKATSGIAVPATGSYEGTYTNVEPGGDMTLAADGTAFTVATSAIPSFSAYISGYDGTLLTIKEVDGPSGLDVIVPGVKEGPVDVYTIDGFRLRHNVPVTEASRGLPPGLYIIGGRKYRVL